ncbi:hypothetical protein BGX28_002085, partial [Mortierella sp. GBA30]
MEAWLPREDAQKMVSTQYGELFRLLLVGDKEAIREDRNKRQTMYGRRVTTMNRLTEHPNMQVPLLQEYLDAWFRYLRDMKAAKE